MFAVIENIQDTTTTSAAAVNDLEPLGDTTVWVDTRFMAVGNTTPVSSTLTERQSDRKSVSMKKFGDGEGEKTDMVAAVGVVGTTPLSTPERELLAMRNAELEQCAVDNFWGVVGNQRQQAESIAWMEREDLESHMVRAQIKKENKFAQWEEEDLRTRETRNAIAKRLDHVAIRGYLEVRVSDHFVILQTNQIGEPGIIAPNPVHACLSKATGLGC